jgi:hypothetical protein
VRWNALPLAALCCVSWLWTPQAEAARDLVPLNGPGHIRVSSPTEDPAIYYPVDPGAELQYAFTGPGKVVIWVRSTRPPDQPWIFGPYLQMPVKADGWSLLELVLRPRLTPMGTVDGEGTPFPSLATAMQVDVTGPCSSLGVMAPGNGPSLLVRVVEVDPGDALLAQSKPATPPPDGPADTLEPATADSDPSLWEAEDTLAVSIFEEAEEPPEEEETPIALGEGGEDPVEEGAAEAGPAPLPATVLPDLTFAYRLEQTLNTARGGVRLGLGAPMQGNRISPYVGGIYNVDALPILWDGWKDAWGTVGLQVGVGWYRVRVVDELHWQDPYSGPVTLDIDYATDVAPLQLDLVWAVPYSFEGITPQVSLGANVLYARRIEDKTVNSGFSGGGQFAVGAFMKAGPGEAAANICWTGARKSFGLVDDSGDVAREGLGVLRLDASFLIPF